MKSLIKTKFFKQKKECNFYTIFFSSFLILLTICLVLNPAKYIKSFYNGLSIWATCVLPSLLPFFIITKLLTKLKCLNKFFDKFSNINKLLFNAPKCSGYIFGMSIISGYPVGAKLINDFYKSGQISSRQATKLTTFCSTSGPLFIIGSIGTLLLGNIKLGYILYFSHILSAILNGILYRNKFIDNKQTPINNNQAKPEYSTLLSDTMLSSITSIMIVGGFVAIFYMIIDIVIDLNIFYPIVVLFDNFFSFANTNGIGNSIVNGIIEVTRGCKDIASLGISQSLTAVILSGLIGFGGLSIHAQSLSFLAECKINIKFYFLQKITQTIIGCVICYLLCLLFF